MRERQANKPFECLEVLSSSVGHKNGLIEGMRPKFDLKIRLVSFKCAIEISNGYLWIIVHAFTALILVGWCSGRVLAFDEDITGSGIDVQSIWNPSNGQVESEEITHVVKAIMLGRGLVVPEIGNLVIGEDSHVMVDNEFVMIGVEQMTSIDSLMRLMLQGKDGLRAGCGNYHS